VKLKSRFVVLIVALTGLCALGGCDSKKPDEPGRPPAERVLRRSIGGEPATLDPGKAPDTFSTRLIRDLYEGLTAEKPDGTVEPGVASAWSTDASGTHYTFHLRKDARWSNGERVTAGNFVAAWRRVVDPTQGSPNADILRPVLHAAEIIAGRLPATMLGVSALEDDRLVVQLEEPAPYFPELLTHSATFPIYSEEAATTHDSAKWVSNGAYILSAWTLGARLELRKNPQYWNRDGVQIARVRYVPVTDDDSELRRYQAGELDLTDNVPGGALPAIRREIPQELLVAPILGTVYYGINLHSPRFAANQKLRQALAMAIDRQALARALLVFGQAPAYGFVPPGTWNYDPQSWDWRGLPDTDRLERAKALYAASGYSKEKPLRLRLLYNSNPLIKRASVALASMWKEVLGIETQLHEEEYRVFIDSRKNQEGWDIIRLAWMADYNDAGDFLNIFRSASPNNDSGYSNADFDGLLDRAASTADAMQRREVLERAERLMLSEYPVIPLYFYSSKKLVKPYVKGARANPLDRLYSKHLYIAE
jgi:oligopeptide transport system substrate-binding protein